MLISTQEIFDFEFYFKYCMNFFCKRDKKKSVSQWSSTTFCLFLVLPLTRVKHQVISSALLILLGGTYHSQKISLWAFCTKCLHRGFNIKFQKNLKIEPRSSSKQLVSTHSLLPYLTYPQGWVCESKPKRWIVLLRSQV